MTHHSPEGAGVLNDIKMTSCTTQLTRNYPINIAKPSNKVSANFVFQTTESKSPLESSLAFCVARSASQCSAEELPLASLEPGVRAMAGPAVLLLALLLPDISALFPSAPDSTFTTAAVTGSPSGRGVDEVDAAPFPVLEAVPDCKIKKNFLK